MRATNEITITGDPFPLLQGRKSCGTSVGHSGPSGKELQPTGRADAGGQGQSEGRNIIGGLVRFGSSGNSGDVVGWYSFSSWSGAGRPAPPSDASALIFTILSLSSGGKFQCEQQGGNSPGVTGRIPRTPRDFSCSRPVPGWFSLPGTGAWLRGGRGRR
jgi:hypothetical protein